MRLIKSVWKKALALLAVFTLLCGVLYPAAVTGISQLLFHDQANGSIIEVDGKKYGSVLLAQQFTGNGYLWGRIMNLETKTFRDSEGRTLMYAVPSNLSPASEQYEKLVRERIEKIQAADPEKRESPFRKTSSPAPPAGSTRISLPRPRTTRRTGSQKQGICPCSRCAMSFRDIRRADFSACSEKKR